MSEDNSKQHELAKRLGVSGHETMTPQELSIAIAAAPATQEQVSFVTALLRFMNAPVPEGLTFRRASQILDEVAPLVDENILMDMGWEQDSVIVWRDDYYKIDRIHANKKVTLVRVKLVRDAPGEPARTTRDKGSSTIRYPFTLMEDGATLVDLNTVVV